MFELKKYNVATNDFTNNTIENDVYPALVPLNIMKFGVYDFTVQYQSKSTASNSYLPLILTSKPY